jgi:hypothetical protein
MEWLHVSFGLMIAFIGLFHTARDYTLQFTITHTYVHSHVFISRCLVSASNGLRSPSSGLPNRPRPQLPVSHSNSSQRMNLSSPLTHSHTHQPTALHLTQLNWTNSTVC